MKELEFKQEQLTISGRLGDSGKSSVDRDGWLPVKCNGAVRISKTEFLAFLRGLKERPGPGSVIRGYWDCLTLEGGIIEGGIMVICNNIKNPDSVTIQFYTNKSGAVKDSDPFVHPEHGLIELSVVEESSFDNSEKLTGENVRSGENDMVVWQVFSSYNIDIALKALELCKIRAEQNGYQDIANFVDALLQHTDWSIGDIVYKDIPSSILPLREF